MNFMNEYSESPIFDNYTYQAVFDTIQQFIGNDPENVKLKINLTSASIYMFKSVAFSIIINSRTQCIRTGSSVAADYVSRLPCAKCEKDTTTIPLNCDIRYKDVLSNLVNEVYEYKRSTLEGEMIGCCDMFIMCSDSLRCLKSDDPHYNGCLYRKNLEAGRIFYGKNKNI